MKDKRYTINHCGVKLVPKSQWPEAAEKLARYEDTGLTPEQIYEMDRLYSEKCAEVGNLKARIANTKGDLIYRQDAIDAVSELLKGIFVEHDDIAKKALNNVPSAEPERKKGKWIWCGDKHVCSECDEFALCDAYDVLETGEYQEELSDYCPNCGADMRGEEDE